MKNLLKTMRLFNLTKNPEVSDPCYKNVAYQYIATILPPLQQRVHWENAPPCPHSRTLAVRPL